MLPESKFPVTGGIMQTEQVAPRAQSVTLEDSPADRSVNFQPVLRYEQHIQYPIPSLVNMAVKQEPQEEEEREREANKLSTNIQQVQTPDGTLNKRGNSDQSSPECDSQNIIQAAQQNGGKKTNSRARRKSRWKLKFHHQALPPEYLDHYEAALAQEAALSSTAASTESAAIAATGATATSSAESGLASPASMMPTTAVHMGAFTPTNHPIVDVQSWLHRLAVMQNEVYPARQIPATNNQPATNLRRSVITCTQSTAQLSQATQSMQPILAHSHKNYLASNSNGNLHRNNAHSQPSQPSPRAPMKYSDLPYMGEITLDNSKPRRGRKPKKADICHLIYKNYGTILPGTPGLEDKLRAPSTAREKIELKEGPIPAFQRTDIQNRISSLLEKRLTQERRAFDVAALESAREQEEPLNLCIRDLNLLELRFAERRNSCAKSEGSSENQDLVNLQEAAQSRQSSLELVNGLDSNCERLEDNPGAEFVGRTDTSASQTHPFISEQNAINGGVCEARNVNDSSEVNPGLLYWPNTALFIHPATLQSQFLYYKKLAEEKGAEGEATKKAGVAYNALENAKMHPKIVCPVEVRAASTPSPRARRRQESSGSLCASKVSGQPGSSGSPGQTGTPGASQNSPSQLLPGNQPMKRKRSAIFIPPMPSENNNNPATEVSICKFKFTGGAKPSLQEKKSLSVDSGGNFRYYSGTGDKSMRGYEFFPREALQQPAQQVGGSSSGAFLTAAAERIPQVSSSPTSCSVQEDSRRKRKSRKSIQREKLEQTFKEKGFLIQTQQLESAEGATYCKFRQLRKFTRYLFRSWKDYLPGNVRELTVDANSDSLSNLKEPEPDTECLPGSPLASSNLELEQTLTANAPAPASLSLN